MPYHALPCLRVLSESLLAEHVQAEIPFLTCAFSSASGSRVLSLRWPRDFHSESVSAVKNAQGLADLSSPQGLRTGEVREPLGVLHRAHRL